MRANSSASRLGPADEGAVDVGLGHQLGDVAGFTDPPYWMRTAAAASCADDARRPWPRIARAHRLGVLGGRRPAGADRPDRLVGDDQRRRPARRAHPASPASTWPSTLRLGRARPRAPRASRRRTGSASSRRRGSRATFLLHHLVGLAEQLAALGVPDDHVARRRAWPGTAGDDLAGERALAPPSGSAGRRARCGMLVALDDGLHRAQVGERRVDRHVDARRSRPCPTR